MLNKKIVFTLFSFMIIIVLTTLVLANISFYDPDSTIQSGWGGTGDTSHTQIVDAARQPSIPDTTTYVSLARNDNGESEFGFPAIIGSNIEEITLWVYTSTGGTVSYTFELRQGGNVVCSNTINSGVSNSWQSCSWVDPSEDLNDMTLFLSNTEGSGQPTEAFVYAAYLEVEEAIIPEVNLISPNNILTNQSVINFEFNVSNGEDLEISECTLYGDFTGVWEANETITNVPTGTNVGITNEVVEGDYVWNVQCTNDEGYSSFAETNFTFTADMNPPIIDLINPDHEHVEKGNDTVEFEYTVNDFSEIQRCDLHIDGVVVDTVLNPERSTSLFFIETLENDVYEWKISCLDEAGNTGESATRLLDVSVYSPNITSIELPETVVLNAGWTKNVECLVNVEDENGAEDINGVNATFYFENAERGVDNNSVHYTNSSCVEISSEGNNAQYNCSFDVWYYAVNGTWICNSTVIDNQGLTGNFYNQTIIDPLYALNLSELTINYGDVPAGSLSEEVDVNVINIGNQDISVSVRGYGGEDPVQGEGYSMICNSGVNINVNSMRYALNPSIIFDDKTPLTSENELTGLQIQSLQTEEIFWQLQTPPSPVTNCSGTVVLTASAT